MSNILIAVLLDTILGDPYSFPHPVKLMGRLISYEEKVARMISNSKTGLKFAGLVIVILNLLLGFFVPYLLLKYIKQYKFVFNIINIYLIYTCIAARCLRDEAIKIYKAFHNGIEEARKRLSYIVGRDTTYLNEVEIVKATIETVAENTSDGVIAPLFFIMLLGAPGGLLYKFVNTMDSMLGYMNERYIDLGFFPAKVDDIFNFIPARITSILMNIGSLGRFNTKTGFRILLRDKNNHKSPNSGYPESAVAGLLRIQLGGNNFYNGLLVEKPTIGDDLKNIDKVHIKNTIEIMYRTLIIFLLLYFLLLYIIKICVSM